MTAMHLTPQSLKLPIVSSAILHVVVLGALVLRNAGSKVVLPPMYRVTLVAAPAGPRAEGVVTTRPEPPTPTKAPPAPERTTTPPPRTKTATRKAAPAPRLATPNVTKSSRPQASKAPPKAGGGPEGGTGGDVANVNTAGIEFPYDGYLRNIVRQIALQFEVPRGAASLRADVTFLIHRDGSVTGIRLIANSGSYVFDQNCLTAVEAAGRSGRFGPLPEGFSDDVLPVIFSFDPRTLR